MIRLEKEDRTIRSCMMNTIMLIIFELVGGMMGVVAEAEIESVFTMAAVMSSALVMTSETKWRSATNARQGDK